MTHRRLVILLICLGAMMACFLVGEIASLPAHAGGHVSVAFLGLTNDAFGAKGALFQFTNGLTRDIGFSAGPIEVKSSEGWPHGSNHTVYVLTHLGPAYKVPSGRAETFTVPVSDVEEATWRAPIVYARVGSRLDSWVDRVKGVLGRPVGGVAWGTNTPEMVGLSNQVMQPTPR